MKPVVAEGYILEKKGISLEDKAAFFDRMAEQVMIFPCCLDFIGGAAVLPMGVAPEAACNHLWLGVAYFIPFAN